jgi:hypothetical protein
MRNYGISMTWKLIAVLIVIGAMVFSGFYDFLLRLLVWQ